jgi:hypothetical protein
VQEILDLNKYFSESDLNEVLLSYLDKVDLLLANDEKGVQNPYTKIRYCLYLSNRDIFSDILTPYQRDTLANN